jgi:hypothetical protein
MAAGIRHPWSDSRRRIAERLSKDLKLETVLHELSNCVDRALAQVCSLVNDSGGNALHASHGRLRSTTSSLPAAGLASAALASGRGFPSATAARRLPRTCRAAFGRALLRTSTLASGGSGPRPLSTTFRPTGFLGCSHGKAPCRRVRRTDSKIRAQQSCETPYPMRAHIAPARLNYPIVRVSPCCMIQRSLASRPAARHCSRIFAGGSSIGSSVSLNVPQWAAVIIRRLSLCAVDS